MKRENKRLHDQNSKLQNEVLHAQREMLHLKVDISVITEGHFETCDQLRTRIAEVMMPICDGRTDEAKWDTSINIPITDCQRLGAYTKNKKKG